MIKKTAILITAFFMVFGKIYSGPTNKTFLMPRALNANLPLEYSIFNELIQIKKENQFGANLQTTAFYSESSASSDIGRYFGVCSKNCFSFHSNWDECPRLGHVIGTQIVHDGGGSQAKPGLAGFNDGTNQTKGVNSTLIDLKLNPKQKTYGLRIDLYQDLKKILEGLYLKVAIPVVHLENNLHLKIYDKFAPETGAPSGRTFLNYFAGNLNVSNSGIGPITGDPSCGSQQKLCKAKMNCKPHSREGVADIDAMLGYKFFDNEQYYVAINLGATIPTGNSPTGDWVFEPIVGNGSHWALGMGTDASVVLWKDDKKNRNVKLTFALNYRYLFKASETRTLGLRLDDSDCCRSACPCEDSCCPCNTSCCNSSVCNPCCSTTLGITKSPDEYKSCGTSNCSDNNCDSCCSCILNYGQYYLLNKRVFDKNIEEQQFIPAANILTTGVDIEPGSQIDSILYFSYNQGGFTIDLGYNLFWKQTEKINLEKDPFCNCSYGIVLPTLASGGINSGSNATNVVFDPENEFHALPNKKLSKCNIATSVAETPDKDTHKIFGAVGYIFRKLQYPTMIGLGGSYEFASVGAIENWKIWAKLGITF